MKYPDRNNIHWQFDTANYRVVFHVEPENMSPRDSFQFRRDWEMVERGEVAWFAAFVSVWEGTDEDDLSYVAHDSLGGCAYTTIREFYTAHRDRDPMNRNCSLMRAAKGNVTICHYFPDMVSEALRMAREEMQRRKAA